MFEIVCYTLAAIIAIGTMMMFAGRAVEIYRANEIRKRGERANLHSPAWADTMLYWRTEAEEW